MSHKQAARTLNGSNENENDEMFLDVDEAGEEIADDEDVAMDSEGENDREEIQLQNDSLAHFDGHGGNSIFCIAQHPKNPNIIVTGGGEDEEGKDVGYGFIFDVSSADQIVNANVEREGLRHLQKLEGHTDSISAVTFTQPSGAFVLTAGLDGRLVVYVQENHTSTPNISLYKNVAMAQEVEEINFLLPSPHREHPDVVALGASDGSVWIYSLDASEPSSLTILKTYYIHTGPCTAAAWTPDGRLLATVSEDGSLYVWDVFGDAAAAGLFDKSSGQEYLIGLTASDERFRVDGGLYSVAISPGGSLVAVGGAEGQIRVVGLPRFGAAAKSGTVQGQTGTILAALAVQSDSIETLAFAPPPVTLLAAGSVDGSIAVFDASKNFALRRKIQVPSSSEDGEGHAIVKVEFVDARSTGTGADASWLLTSAGYDGVLRRWDLRASGTATGAGAQGLIGEWKGHRGGGDGGGVMGFVQGIRGGSKVVTAGDDGVTLVFDMTNPPSL